MSPSPEAIGYSVAIETSGRLGGVALGCGPTVLRTAAFSAEQRHAVELLPTIDRLCREEGIGAADVSECYVSGGPGSFTGMRIGVTVARTLAMAGGVGIVRVPTLDVVAQNALEVESPPPTLGVVLDAKRGKVYAAAYVLRDGRYVAVGEPAEREPGEFAASLPRPAAIMGEGIPFVREALGATEVPLLHESSYRARAEVVYRLGFERSSAGDFDEPGQLIPIYVRRPEAEEVWLRRYGSDARTNQ